MPSVTVCDNYILPAITVANEVDAAYYTQTNKGGVRLDSGDVVSATQTLFIYDETGTIPNCSSEESVLITVNTTPDITDYSCSGFTTILPSEFGFSPGDVNQTGTADVSATFGYPTGSIIVSVTNVDVRGGSDDFQMGAGVAAGKVTFGVSGDVPVRIQARHGRFITGPTNARDGIIAEDGASYSFNGTVFAGFSANQSSNDYFVNKDTVATEDDAGTLRWESNGFADSLSFYNTEVGAPGNLVGFAICAPIPTAVCDSFELPAITGALTGNEGYYSEQNGGGVTYNVGDFITSNSSIYIYDSTTTSPTCHDEEVIVTLVNTTPIITAQPDSTNCDSIELPSIMGVLSGNERYYDGSLATGTSYSAGDYITSSGTYYIYDSTGGTPNCFTQDTFVVVINSSPVITTSKVDPTVCGGSDGTITISGLTGGLSYDWSYDTPTPATITGTTIANGSGEIEISSSLSAGSYTNIFVTLDDCESNIESEDLSDPSAPSISVTIQQPDCNLDNGELYIAGLDDTYAYDLTYDSLGTAVAITLNPTNDTITLTGLGAGTYQNIAIDSNNCVDSDAGPFQLTNPTSPTITVTKLDPTCAGGDGELYIAGVSDGFTYDVTYDNGAVVNTTQDPAANDTIEITGLSAGNITNISVDSLGCQSNTIASITLDDPVDPVITTSIQEPTCAGGDGILYVIGVSNGFTYDVTYNNGAVVNTTQDPGANDTIEITGFAAGNVTNISIDSLGCQSNVIPTVTFTDPTNPVITTSIQEPTCAGGDGELYIIGLSNGFTYDVTYDNGGVVNTTQDPGANDTIEITGLAAGNITNISIDSLGCQSNIIPTVTLTDPTPPSITIQTVAPTCAGGDGEIHIIGLANGFNYGVSYDNPGTTNTTGTPVNDTLKITSLSAGTYTNVSIDSLGCTDTEAGPFNLTNPGAPTISVAVSNPQSCGASDGALHIFNLDNTFAYDVTYNDGAVQNVTRTPVNDTITITGLSAGNITNISVDSLGCSSNIEDTLLTDPTAPVITVSTVEPTCALNDGQIHVTGVTTGFTYGLTYDSLGTGVTTTGTPVNDTIKITNLPAGAYGNVTIDSLNCLDTEVGPFTLTDPTNPQITTSIQEPTCGTNDGILYIHSLDNTFQYDVTYNDGAVNNQTTTPTNDTIAYSGFGPGDVTAIQVDSLGCVSNVEVATFATPLNPTQSVATPLPATICEGESSDVILTNFTGAIQWQESADGINGWTDIPAETNDTTIVTLATAGSYFYRALTHINNGCEDTSNVAQVDVLTQPEAGTITLTDPLCVNDSLDIVATGASTAGLQWQISADGSTGWTDIPTETDDTIRVAYAAAQTQFYRLIAGSGLCQDTSNVAQLDVVVCCIAPTVAEVTPLGPIDVCVGTDTLLTVTNTDAPAGYIYTWFEAGDTTTPVSGPLADLDTFRTATPGDYFVRIQMPNITTCYLNSNEVSLTNLPIAVPGTATAIPASICDGQTADIILTGYTGNITWQSSIDNTNWDNHPTETNDTLTVNPDTTSTPMFYRAAVVNSGICSDTSNVAVLQIETQANAGFAIASPNTICEGNSSTISLTAFSGGNIQWQDSTAAGWQDIALETNNTLTQTPTEGVSIYRAIIGGAGNCPDTSSTAAIITLEAAIGGTATSEPGTICEGESADIILTGYLGTIQWQEFTGGTWSDITSATNDTMTVTPQEGTDDFRAIVTNSGQCTDTSNAATLTVVEAVVAGNIIPENDTVCDGDVTILQVLNSVGTIQWQSSISNTTSWNNMSPGTNSSQAVQADAANALVFYRVTVTNGTCDDTTDFTSLTTMPVVVLDVQIDGPASVCVGADATFTITDSTGGGSNPSFEWTFNNAPQATGNTMTLSPTTVSGTVGVSMTSDSACATSQPVSAAQFLTVNPLLVAEVDLDFGQINVKCAGEIFDFSASGMNGGTTPTFTWYVNSSAIGLTGMTYSTDTLKNLDTVSVIMTPSAEACISNKEAVDDQVVVVVYELPSVGELTPKTDSICYEEVPTIAMDDHLGTIEWQWSSDAVNWNALINETAETITIDPLDYIGSDITTPTPIFLRAEVTNQICSPAISDSVQLVKFPELKGTAALEQDCDELEVTIYQDDSENFFTNFTTWYYGTDANNLTADVTLPEVIEQTDTSIIGGYYMAEFTNSINCPALYDTVYVEDCPPPAVDIPNALTPNGDGDNETFWIRNIWYYPSNELRVYNRWGSLVYKEKGYNNDWDGTINGEPLPDATYWFILDLGNGETIYNGDVTIFR